ncbi:hypothetical protein AB9L15_13430 [Lysinibacillus fusiformis]|uniref:hypothetical protein n=1 Tax=Lysinibacillus fusiformis TaxID=28031 RepID=UPI0035C1942C
MKKIFIRIICIVFALSMITPSLAVPASAAEIDDIEGKIILEKDNYIFSLSESEDGNSLLQVTNSQTNEVEYLEITKNEENTIEMIASNEDGSYQELITLDKNTKATTLENLNTGEIEVLEEIIVEEPTIVTPFPKYGEDIIAPRALPGGNGDYVLYMTYKGKKSIDTTYLTGVIGILFGLSVLNLPKYTKKAEEAALVIISGIALIYVSIKTKEAYYIGELYLYRDSFHYPATWTRYFKWADIDDNYAGLIDATFVKSNHE